MHIKSSICGIPVPRILMGMLVLVLVLPLLALSIYGARHAYRRFHSGMPLIQNANRNQALAERKLLISSQRWLDSRPLVIFAGDSHIEFGNWYQWFRGKHALRNCGMATARIEDVTELVGSIREPTINTLLLHCGVNNLGRDELPDDCLEYYSRLLDQAEALDPERIIVVAVMPVRQSPVDLKTLECNRRIHQFNILLKDLCRSRNIPLLDLGPTVEDASGGLKAEFTDDGLHLNSLGYSSVTPLIADGLSGLR